MRRAIDAATRHRLDYLRRKGLKTADTYVQRLRRLRAKEVRRVLKLCQDYDADNCAGVIDTNLNEPYLRGIETGLIVSVGLPQARSTMRDLSRAKAGSLQFESMWEREIRNYAEQRAGSLITTLTGTLKDDLRALLAREMAQGVTSTYELTQLVYAAYRDLEEWQAQRIVRTEAMIGLGNAANVAARTSGYAMTKQWAVSGNTNSRDTHLAVDGIIVDGDEPFKVGNSYLMFPHDTSLAADASEIVNCACSCLYRQK